MPSSAPSSISRSPSGRAAPGSGRHRWGSWSRWGTATLLEVPITIRRHFLGAIPGTGRRFDVRARWLRPTLGTPAALVRVAEDEMAAARRCSPTRPVILNAMLRNVEVVPSASPYGDDEAAAHGILDRLRALLAYARREAIAVIGLGDVPSILATSAASDQGPRSRDA